MPKKKKPQPEFKIAQHRTVSEADWVRDPKTGVEVTPFKTSMGPAEAARHRRLSFVVTTENGVPVERVQVMDVLDRLLEKGFIDRRLYGAGKEFRAAYEAGERGLYPSVNMAGGGGGAGASDPMVMRMYWTERRQDMYRLLGGHNSNMCRVMRLVVGEGRSFDSMVRDYSHGWNEWRGLLLGALEVLAGAIYGDR